MKSRRILITGCSGAGKSTLLAALAARGHVTIAEPGRRIIAEERAKSGRALPWRDLHAFADRAFRMAKADFRSVTAPLVFFDRGLLEAALIRADAQGVPVTQLTGGLRYDDPVFLAPPWPELYQTDDDRRHGLDDAIAEYDRIYDALRSLEHDVRVLPKVGVAERVAFVQAALATSDRPGTSP